MPHALAQKILLIGWDGADWQMIHPLLDAGLMPTLKRLVDEGTMGQLASLSPMLSPILWTSIATGKRAYAHGIHGLVEPKPDGSGLLPVQSTSRTTKALWNILTQAGKRTHALGWYASHPAEPIAGVCLSHQFAPAPDDTTPGTWNIAPGSVHPPDLAEMLSELRLHPHEVDASLIQSFIPRAAEMNLQLPAVQHFLTVLRKRLAECISVHAAATAIIEEEPWDFCTVYYECIDQVGHDFMPFHLPRLPTVSVEASEMFRDVMNGIYRFHDLMLARLLELAGPETHVMLVSDHGFLNDHRRPLAPVEPARWHRLYGVFCLHGPGVKADETIYGASLLDITPTVLNMFGLPVGEDMEGKVLGAAFVYAPEIERIPSWDAVPGPCGMHSEAVAEDPAATAAALQQLVELGYLEAPGEDVQRDLARAGAEQRFNLAATWLDGGRPDQALAILQTLCAEFPAEPRYAAILAQAGLSAHQPALVRGALGRLEELVPGQAQLDYLSGSLAWMEGDLEASHAAFSKALLLAPNDAWLQCRIGRIYLRQRRWVEAEAAFRRALAIDPDLAEAHYGMSVAIPRQGRPEEGIEYALRAVGLQHNFPEAHFQLGAVLSRLAWFERAAQAFEIALSLSPGLALAHRYLSRIYARVGRADLGKKHREQADQLLRDRVPQRELD